METWAANGDDEPVDGDDHALLGLTVGSRYEIVDVLGDGGMATVYEAVDQIESRPVAIKVMRGSMSDDEALRRRFRNEAQATMSIVDPHVVEIIDLGELDDGTPFYVMERLEGLPLDEYAHGRLLPIDDVLQVGMQICRGLAAAHRKGFIHRDLKPENVFVAEGLDVKVLDFGVAKVPTATNLTVPGSVFGTPCYMSPEQAVPRREVDLRTDIYSLGVILYELLTGEVPFGCGDPMQVMLSHVGQPPDPVRKRRPEVPSRIARIIDRCLEKKPERRFETMRQLCEALEAAAAGEDDASAPEIEVEETHAPTEVNQTILFDPSKMAITVDDLVEGLAHAPTEPDAPEYPADAEDTVVSPESFAFEDRLPTPPGPQPWQQRVHRPWLWSCVLLVPLLFAVAYFALG